MAVPTGRVTPIDATHRPRTFIAVDWSGARSDVRKRLFVAESRSRRVTRLENGRTREETVAHLIECAASDPRLVVGLDFAFSFPRWFLEEKGLEHARAIWELVAREGETWLCHCPHPFWGRPGVRSPRLPLGASAWRATEGETTRVRGIGPKTVFQIGGAGSVGTGSLRGMPHLCVLRDAGFSIWPFDPPRLPLVVEIYPRDLTGAVTKSSRVARALFVQTNMKHDSRAIQDLATASEDAFDAAVSAACMRRFAHDFEHLDRHRTPLDRLEGRIWRPHRDPMFGRA